jgi:hypothetical protein
MELPGRIYWFLKNLSAFILLLIVRPLYCLWEIIISIKVLFVTDGSEELLFPWEYDWMGWRGWGGED